MKPCPNCAEPIQDAAKVCRHCGWGKPNPITQAGCNCLTIVIVIAVLILMALVWLGRSAPSY